MVEQHTIELEIDKNKESNQPGPERTFVLEVPDRRTDHGYLLLMADEGGMLLWILPDNEVRPVRNPEGPDRLQFRIPRYVAPPEREHKRLIFGKVGRKLLKILSYPLHDPVFGELSRLHAVTWELANVNMRLLHLHVPADVNRPPTFKPVPKGHTWKSGKILVLLHGTFSSTREAFGTIDPVNLRILAARYPDGVFAYDHPTVAFDPLSNARKLYWRFPPGLTLDVDILCHSRGGLVARALDVVAQNGGGCNLTISKIVFVATPNGGTPTATMQTMSKYCSIITSLANVVPSKFPAPMLLALKMAKQGAAQAIKGVLSMDPQGPFLWQLPPAVNAIGYAICSDFSLAASRWWPIRALDRMFIRPLFAAQPNDLIVPTASVVNGVRPGFTLQQSFWLAPADRVWHAEFFQNAHVFQVVNTWIP